MRYQGFTDQFGNPRPGSAVPLERLGLEACVDLSTFVAEIGAGIFSDGFFSIASIRENLPNLGGWERWLPPNSRMFACSVFGIIYATRGDDMWVIDTQAGEVIESDLSVHESILSLCEAETRDTSLRLPLFRVWNAMSGPLPATSVLTPTPALALGGDWDVTTFSCMTLAAYLPFTAQLFGQGGTAAVRILRLDD